ncbi:AAA family ATPase [Myroides marinus]|uniref:ATPase n=1 Tax=Myroides marinus TaxID=703342 RepID=A0A161RYI6_9FLAO|nr:AAA family ATPase [Myroides marinus]KZE76719.1 ATPase [Myroides marinus]MDM1368321.1 AAA family ATPase [Myroides marinus]MDM1390305.1 AAA family ATPase [Myroides marinus]
MLDKVEIKGYKSIKELSMEIAPINILIGANGSGKSNFLSFFNFLKEIYKQNLQQYVALNGGTERFLHKGNKVTTDIVADVQLKANTYSFLLKEGESGFVFLEEGIGYKMSKFNIASYGYEARIKNDTTIRSTFIRDYLDSIIKYHFHDTGKQSPFHLDSNINSDHFLLYEDGRNLAAFLYGIKKEYPKQYNLIVRTIQSVAPYFSDFYLQPNENGNVQLFWTSKYSSTIYSSRDLSDGTIRFIALTLLFMQPKLPSTIIIDEPELGLHPFAINKLSGMIKSVSKKGTKVILATQSTDLISYFEPEDIITVDQIEGESVFKRLDSENLKEWLDTYTIDDLWKRNIINSGQPNS